MKIPFLDLKTQYETIRGEVNEAIQAVIDQTAFAGGPFVETFEQDFAAFCGCKYSVGCGSGTSALWIALLALGVGPGDEVITVPNTFIATVEAITCCGAIPVFVDADEETFTMSPERLEASISSATRAIIPVHLYGRMAEMDRIVKIADRHGIPVIEDAAQAHGAQYKSQGPGQFGRAACFSFYPGKNLGAYGEAGAIATNDPEIVDFAKRFRDHGQSKKYYHSIPGWNDRMDGLQGAVLSVKLKHLPRWNESRRSRARMYFDLLREVSDLGLPAEPAADGKHVYHLYVVRSPLRDALISHLNEKGIGAGIHYPVPVHLQQAYESLGLGPGSFPSSEKLAGEILSLPMFPELSDEAVAAVADAIRQFYSVKV